MVSPVGSSAPTKPCRKSENVIASLHCSKAKLCGETCPYSTTETSFHVVDPSVVLQSCAPCCAHCVPGAPVKRAHPLVSSTNEIRGLPPPGYGGPQTRCCQVLPWSVERNRYWFATSAQTTLALG